MLLRKTFPVPLFEHKVVWKICSCSVAFPNATDSLKWPITTQTHRRKVLPPVVDLPSPLSILKVNRSISAFQMCLHEYCIRKSIKSELIAKCQYLVNNDMLLPQGAPRATICPKRLLVLRNETESAHTAASLEGLSRWYTLTAGARRDLSKGEWCRQG